MGSSLLLVYKCHGIKIEYQSKTQANIFLLNRSPDRQDPRREGRGLRQHGEDRPRQLLRGLPLHRRLRPHRPVRRRRDEPPGPGKEGLVGTVPRCELPRNCYHVLHC